VLLVRLRSIGDTVLMTPCLGALKSWRPDIRITVVSEPLAAPLLEHHLLVDELVVSSGGTRARISLIQKLRHARFDVAFNLHGGSTATIISALSGARCTVGYQGYRYSWLLKMRAPAPDILLGRKSLHSVEQQLALLCWTGVPWPRQVELTLPISTDSAASVLGRLKQTGVDRAGPASQGYAVLSPCASAESKIWPAASFAEVAVHLKTRYQMASVVIAGPGEESIARRIAASAKGCAVDLTGLDLKELVALIAYSNVFIGNDSGPMHIAAAFDRPLVAIFGGSNPTVWNPWTGGPHRVLVASAEGDGNRAPGSLESALPWVAADIGRISVPEVIGAIDSVIEAQPSPAV
jgi:ADP-heptose:LPS heptosyltransferase